MTQFTVQVFSGGTNAVPVFTAKVDADDPTEAVVLVADEIRATRPPKEEDADEQVDQDITYLTDLEGRVIQLEHGFQLMTRMVNYRPLPADYGPYPPTSPYRNAFYKGNRNDNE